MMKYAAFSALTAAAMLCGAAEPEALFRKQVREVMPNAEQFRENGPRSWEILDASGSRLGELHQERISDRERQKGFGGPVEVALVTDAKDRISAVLVGKNSETPAFLKRVAASGFLKRWNEMTMRQAAEAKVDAVSGATYTSSAISHGVKTLAETLRDTGNAPRSPAAAAKTGNPALLAEAAQLERETARRSCILSRAALLLDQWQKRRAEELEMREILMLRGINAAREFAAKHNMLLPARAVAAELPTTGGKVDLARLRAGIAEELDARRAELRAHCIEQAKGILAGMRRLDAIYRELGRERPCAEFFQGSGEVEKKNSRR